MIWGFLRRKGLDAVLRSHERELAEAILILKGMDADDIACLLLFAADFRNSIKSLQDVLLDLPELGQERNKWLPFQLSQAYQKQQSARDFTSASAIAIWLHTARAGQYPQLRYSAKLMWRELERGFPLAGDALEKLEREYGARLDVVRAIEFPLGLNPHL